jgi:hypothetical protein
VEEESRFEMCQLKEVRVLGVYLGLQNWISLEFPASKGRDRELGV